MKRKLWLIIPALIIIFLLLAAALLALPLFRPAKAALQINTNPQATVFVNGEHVGQTPYLNEDLKAQEYSLKLVPESNQISWEKNLKLTPKTLTAINWDFTGDTSQGEILQLEAIANSKSAQIYLVSDPDSAIVKLDGQPQGFTPVTLEDISAGDHLIIVSSPGYLERKITAKAALGYRLNINLQLARDPSIALQYQQEASPSAEPSSPEEPKPATDSSRPSPKPSPSPKTATSSAKLSRPYVEILATPTGWLRVRSSPSTGANEIAKVNPGETYPFIEANDNGWYKIKLSNEQQGWISGQYATLYR